VGAAAQAATVEAMAINDVLYAGGRRLDETARAQLRRYWAWYVALGVAVSALGVLAISSSTMATFVAVRLFGWALLAAGVLEVGHGLWEERWRGLSLFLVAGVFYVVVGTAVLVHPARSALALTLVVAVFLVVQGTLRVVISLAHRDHGWGFTLFHGVVSLALGVLVWRGWPVSGTWVLGLFIGIELLLTGISIAAYAFSAHREGAASEPEPAMRGGADPAGA
jgi:uncharacterized membrane protein HdeD (DUF308 family)